MGVVAAAPGGGGGTPTRFIELLGGAGVSGSLLIDDEDEADDCCRRCCGFLQSISREAMKTDRYKNNRNRNADRIEEFRDEKRYFFLEKKEFE